MNSLTYFPTVSQFITFGCLECLEIKVGGERGGFVVRCGWLEAKQRLIEEAAAGDFLNGDTTWVMKSFENMMI